MDTTSFLLLFIFTEVGGALSHPKLIVLIYNASTSKPYVFEFLRLPPQSDLNYRVDQGDLRMKVEDSP